jgi:flagellar biosynthesis protein FlhG
LKGTGAMGNNCEMIGITSGKGGVGKTFFTVNFAITAAKAGKRVLVIDADLGLANVHIMAGIYPEHDMLDLLEGKANIDDIIAKGPQNIHIIPGASGMLKLSNLTHARRAQLVKKLAVLEDRYDLILIDTEAGISHNVLKFLSIVDRMIVLTTPDLTALADAYAVIKVLVTKKLNKNKDISLIVNRVKSFTEGASIYSKIKMASDKFLNTEINLLGYIFEDHQILRESIKQRKPAVESFPKSKLALNIKDIASKVLKIEAKNKTEGNVVLNRFSMLLNSIKVKETVNR